jgi:hypothetical protein
MCTSAAAANFRHEKKINSLWVDPLLVNYVIETIEPMQENIPN